MRILWTTTLKNLSDRELKKSELQKKITQQQLAEMIDIDQRSLSTIECGNNFPTKNLLKIANSLGVELKEIFDYEHISLSEDEKIKEISTNLKKLSAHDLNIVYRLVKTMV